LWESALGSRHAQSVARGRLIEAGESCRWFAAETVGDSGWSTARVTPRRKSCMERRRMFDDDLAGSQPAYPWDSPWERKRVRGVVVVVYGSTNPTMDFDYGS